MFWLDAAGLQQLYEEKVGCSDLLALLGDGPARLSGTQRYMSALRVVLCSPVEPRFGCRLPTEGVLCSTLLLQLLTITPRRLSWYAGQRLQERSFGFGSCVWIARTLRIGSRGEQDATPLFE